jgi:multiple sugar transport system permease protein
MANKDWLYILPVVVFLLVLVAFPMVYFHVLMFMNYHFGQEMTFYGIQNFVHVLTDSVFYNSIIVSLQFMLTAVVLEFALGLGIALALNNIIKGKGILRALFIIPITIAPIAVGLIWKAMLEPGFGPIPYYTDLLGIRQIDQPFLGAPLLAMPLVILADIWENTPFMALVLEAGLAVMPLEQLESAKVDGASGLQVLKWVTIPNLRPYIVIAVIFRVMDAFRVYDIIYVMTSGGPAMATFTAVFYTYKTAFVYLDMGAGAVMSFFLMWFIQLLTLYIIRFRQR